MGQSWVGAYTEKLSKHIQEAQQTIGSSLVGGGCVHRDGCLLGTLWYCSMGSQWWVVWQLKDTAITYIELL